MISIVTHSVDNARSGSNLHEPVLTAPAVAKRGIRRLFSVAIPGDTRGCEAQPLIAAGIKVADGSTRSLLLLSSMGNVVQATDADIGGDPIWQRTLATPVIGSRKIDMFGINDHFGIMSTGVLDLETGTWFVCAWHSLDGQTAGAQHFLHALDIADGTDKAPPLNLEGAYYPSSPDKAVLQFASAARKQRAALLLATAGGRKTVFIGFGSLTESLSTSRGWVIAVDCDTMSVASAWASTTSGSGGGIWQAGAGPAASADGKVYLVTGNGDFDGAGNLSESLVELDYAPAGPTQHAALTASDWWTPFTDAQRTGGMTAEEDDADEGMPGMEGMASPSNHRPLHAAARQAGMTGMPGMVDQAMPMSAWGDMDLGSAGPLVIERLGLMLAAGKDGVLYAAKLGGMGKTQPGDLKQEAVQHNYARLAFAPIFFTYYPPSLSPHPYSIASLNVLWANRSRHLHGAPVHFASPDHGDMLFCWGENGNLRAWQITQASVEYLACGAEVASPNSPVPPGGMPGAMIHVSADGATPGTGVVWATVPYGDANMEITNGRLLAYDAQAFDTYPGGGKQLRVLWDSERWNLHFVYGKFSKPVTANGKLYVPTYAGTVDVYGLA